MNRNIKKSFWMSREEKDNLERKAQASCLTESEFIRQRIIGYEPPQAIDDRFWQAMDTARVSRRMCWTSCSLIQLGLCSRTLSS